MLASCTAWLTMMGNTCESCVMAAGLFEKGDPGGYLFRGAYALHYHFSNPEKILIQGAGSTIWTTDNFGQNWRKLASPGMPYIALLMNIWIALPRTKTVPMGLPPAAARCLINLPVRTYMAVPARAA